VAVFNPADTVTKDGGAAEGSELDKVTMSPPVGATDDRVTVPVTLPPPSTLVGEMERPLTETVVDSVPIA